MLCNVINWVSSKNAPGTGAGIAFMILNQSFPYNFIQPGLF